jgi:aminoglycoside phosphotransferase family enzyme/predicted kinase
MTATRSSESMIESLLRPQAYDHPVDAIQLLETHISWVLLTGRYAYKIKKPVNLGFVDFTTPDRRRWFCEEEVRLNRRLAADLYLGVRTIHGPAERAGFAGDGPVIDWAVQMRQFPQEALLATALAGGKIEGRHWRDLADTLAAFQAGVAVARDDDRATDGFGTPALVGAEAQANLEALAACPQARGAVPALQRWTDRAFATLAPVIDRRRRALRVREGHGDLHLGNMVFLEDRITVFDCLEFNAELRWIDVISELAFLVMDLAEHGRAREGALLLDRWLDRTGDYAGLALWRWYMVYRALVRAKVGTLRLNQAGPDAAESPALAASVHEYLDCAQSTIDAPPGQLVITHGVSGSGKSHLSRRLCEHLGWIQLRSDAERKRLFGLWGTGAEETEALNPDLYRPEVTERLYGEVLPEQAAAVIQAGFSVIVDATFLKAHHRQVMADVAARCGARFRILDCRTSASLAQERIRQRQQLGGDPSDADTDVLAGQWTAVEALSPKEMAAAITVEAGCDVESLAARLA